MLKYVLPYFAALCLLISSFVQGCDLTGTWTAVRHAPHGAGSPVAWNSYTSEEYYILADAENKSKLLFQSITEQGTGWSYENGKWDDYSTAPGSGAWGSGYGSVKEDGTSIQVFLDPGVTDPKSTQDKPNGRYQLKLQATIENPKECRQLQWDNASGTVPPGFTLTWVKQEPIKKVHLLFMNHLDVGYAIHLYEGNPYGFISNVLNTYQREYIPRAISLQKTLRAMNRPERFIYTTQPWLISLYIDCPPNFVLANSSKLYCPTDAEVRAFEEAVHLGDIVWQDGPFNLEPENCMTDFLFEAGLNISLNLNERFKIKSKTRVFSQRDVPSMTRAVVPILHDYGFQAISVGQNPDTPKLFVGAKRWLDRESGKDIIWINHPYGYPSSPGPSGKHCHGVCRRECTVIPGFEEALCFGFRSDNAGPPTSIEMVLHWFEITREQFPGATVESSTFSMYIDALLPYKNKLPTITSEAGDVWIQGVASDPYKMAVNRALTRVLSTCIMNKLCSTSDPKIRNSTRMLVKIPEHTWGLPSINVNGKTDNVNWRNVEFEKARASGPFRAGYTDCHEGWREQRLFNDYALAALKGHPVYSKAKAAVDNVRVPYTKPALNEYNNVGLSKETFVCGNVKLAFDTVHGGLSFLEIDNKIWVDSTTSPGTSRFLSFSYSTYNESDYDQMHAACTAANNNGISCGYGGYDKPNSTCNQKGCPAQKTFKPILQSIHVRKSNKPCEFLLDLQMPTDSHIYYGSVANMWVNVSVVADRFNVDIVALNKTATRLPESMMLEFFPKIQDHNHSWWMNKLGSWITPYEVNKEFLGGNVWQHAINKGIVYGTSPSKGLMISSLDVPVVAPGTENQDPSPFIKTVEPLQDQAVVGFGFNMWNNIWNTNYIFYYPYLKDVGDENLRFRFEIQLIKEN